ncbi:MAG: T9SS type A sorting domain-containing protein [Candidatus Delongbacteria bacterium]|jgi:tetratricopeptide (TPR) repeat protein|nr:T9SS type A sorting domain-containing protein [Candidatus Delongbacteria bacterium]
MKKFSLIVLFLLCAMTFAQVMKLEDAPLADTDPLYTFRREFPVKGNVELPIIFATFQGDEDIKMFFDTDQITHPTAPSMFKLPDGQTIEEYIAANGTYDFKEYVESAVQDYYNEVTKGDLQVDVVFYDNPARPSDGLWVLQPASVYNATYNPDYPIGLLINVTNDLYNMVIEEYPDLAGVEDINYLYPNGLLTSPYSGLAGGQPFSWTDINGIPANADLYRTITFFEDNFNQSVLVLVHEIAHNLMILGDQDLNGTSYGGFYEDEFMGESRATAPPYDPMFHNGMMGAPYSLYGLYPTHTWDLIHQTYLDSTDFAILEEEDHDLFFTNNKCEQKILNVRKELTERDRLYGIRNGIIIPIHTDFLEPDDHNIRRYYKQVESQNFLIELRSGTGFDNIGGIGDDGESKGILISHMINCYRTEYDPANPTIPIKQYTSYNSILDIESATPYPVKNNSDEPYRDPELCYWIYDDVTGTYIPNEYRNGIFYDGKDCVDWMDDVVSRLYDCEGGDTAYDGAPKHASLPSDFFNDTNLNKFTPSTRPSSCSYKQVDLHLGIFIDRIVGDYAELTIYKNYWSKPMTDGSDGTISDYGYIGEEFEIGNETILTADNNSIIKFLPNSSMTMLAGSKFILSEGTELILTEGCELIIEDGADLEIESGAKIIIEGNAKITGNMGQSPVEIVVTDDSQLTFGEDSYINFENTVITPFTLGINSELVIEKDAEFKFAPYTQAEYAQGSKITIQDQGSFISYEANMIGIDQWQGIVIEDGGKIALTSTTINNADCAVSGSPGNCDIYYSTFTDCDNGISLFGCDDFYIVDNTFVGKGIGNGLAITASDGDLRENRVSNYQNGVQITLCSPDIYDNTISNNVNYGLHITGYNAYPNLVSPTQKGLNNEISYNGLGQIYLKYWATIKMDKGRNNVFTDYNITTGLPEVPCIVGESHLATKLTPPWIKGIPAEYNYWGYENVNVYFFDLYERYSLDYRPWEPEPYSDDEQSPIPGNELSFDERMLIIALGFELDGKYDQSIDKLEKILERNETLDDSLQSEEYAFALVKLPSLYVREDQALEPLEKIFDAKIESDDESIDKKFYKEMKISTKIKGKKYDEAIALAEEMKDDATTEGEILLAEIDIAIANMKKNSENKGKIRSDQSATISDLLAKLNGTEGDEEKTDIVESAVPSEFTLYQNYPNPFNPTTEIKFALPTASDVKLNVYNINGQLVSELLNGSKEAGIHKVNFDASNFNSGMYFYTLEANGRNFTKKMILTK